MMCEVILFFAGAIICALLLWVFILDGKIDDCRTICRKKRDLR